MSMAQQFTQAREKALRPADVYAEDTGEYPVLRADLAPASSFGSRRSFAGSGPSRLAIALATSSLPQPLMAVPAYLLVEWFEPVLPVGLGFAGGAMVWMVARQLLPDALRSASPVPVAGALTAAAAAMVVLQLVLLG